MKGYGLSAGEVSISTKEVADEDWNTAWQKYYHVIDFSRHLAIVPSGKIINQHFLINN